MLAKLLFIVIPKVVVPIPYFLLVKAYIHSVREALEAWMEGYSKMYPLFVVCNASNILQNLLASFL